ncbi:MAG TPA: xanthine dehydrogenase family protein subunit M [Dehalococcoidia bacterium]
MKPAPFAYFDPRTLEDAIALLDEHGADAKVLAGGQSLVPLLNMRLARPAVLVDINRIDGLDYIRDDGVAIAFGAMTRQREVERSPLVREKLPLLHEAMTYIAHPQIRNRGTIGGSLAHADPAAELPAVAQVLEAEFVIAGPGGSRTVTSNDFFVTYLTSCLEPNEVLTEVRFPVMSPDSGWSFIELSRRHGDFALAGVAVTMRLTGGQIADARIGLFGVDATALRAAEAEALLRGQRPDEALFARAGEAAALAIEEPLSDIHASAEFRRDLARVLTQRALSEAAGRATS